TIEAGLIIKGFVASGHIGRLLILAPKHVLQQWQQELYSKFRLKVWLLDGNYVYGPQFHPDEEPEKEPVNPENPFATKNMMLVSSQLARLDPRQEQLLQRHYDLIVVDEAHHARATYDGMSRKPNKLLNLLQNLRYQTQGLLLLTATPIQVDRRELWDLLNILELPGKWQDPDKFNAFIEALDTEPTDWGFLLSMAGDYYQHLEDPAELTKNIEQDYPDVQHFKLLDIIAKQKVQGAYQLGDREKEALKLMLYRCTPIRGMAFRHSRELLKEYKKQGKFHGKIAEREPHSIKIELSGSEDDETSEKGLYKRIEKYVKKYYGKYKGIRQGLGFVMVVYRKRLTSSFEAIKLSLQRRYEKLEEALETGDPSVLFAGLLVPEGREWEDLQGLIDIEEEDLELAHDDASAVLKAPKTIKKLLDLVEEEHNYLEGFLHDLKNLTTDSKFEDFRERLRDLTGKGVKQVIVFSQFKDTVDYLKNRFVPIFKERIGTYTGAGGEYYEDGTWHTCSKQEIQAKFRDDHDPLSILFCTDAASESLNLQTCSHVFNYDIPWNPMRIEQRIGRVDRIGQEADIVHVYTYSYKDTVEERAYYRCLERINYFRTTLGYLQPILDATRKAIHEATMESDESHEEEIIEKHFRNVAEVEEEKTIQYLLNTYEPEFEKLKEKVPITQ
ncbi:MAG: DEAD/DEAH box helicase family protein, partial [Deltaproteobacteria bacterium]|nr:DEAD/DEAH box helicase family protein [Deltaproteobacteria bacterium]